MLDHQFLVLESFDGFKRGGWGRS
jgi:hypothetical protein